jgi:Rod binding domain-containing protein
MSTIPQSKTPMFGNRPDYALMQALSKVSPEQQQKAKTNAQEFEAVFLNSMFQQMFSGVKGDGPMGSSSGTGAWRSMLVDEHAKSFAKSGGVGISNDVFRTLIMQQAGRAS